jgi:hypothetical protein
MAWLGARLFKVPAFLRQLLFRDNRKGAANGYGNQGAKPLF